MKKEDSLKLEEERFPELAHLYNAWMDKTMFMSSGATCTDEWKKFIECAKNEPKVFADFALTYLEEDGSNWIILSAVDEVIGSPIRKSGDNIYINPNLDVIKDLYIIWLDDYKNDRIKFDENGELYSIAEMGDNKCMFRLSDEFMKALDEYAKEQFK